MGDAFEDWVCSVLLVAMNCGSSKLPHGDNPHSGSSSHRITILFVDQFALPDNFGVGLLQNYCRMQILCPQPEHESNQLAYLPNNSSWIMSGTQQDTVDFDDVMRDVRCVREVKWYCGSCERGNHR
mmetsp:Transcript_23765/g.51478  ORF Transcript_23765/g.51478 Transcript_23765/m.51478 type:complete len:126 (-) Transcript_23765:64-441(-)